MANQRIDSDLIPKMHAICVSETDHVTFIAVIAGELFHSVERFDWGGFCRLTAPGELKLGTYQRGLRCLMIPFEKGACGAAVWNRKNQIVDDFRQFNGHIAVAASTQSDLVILGFDRDQNLLAVLDIHSDQPAFFSQELAKQIETLLVRLLA